MSAPQLFTGSLSPEFSLVRGGREGGRFAVYRTWALHVSDNGSGLVIHELDADLSHSTTRT